MEEPPQLPPISTPTPESALTAFAPVPRRLERVDGWSPDHQRAFIAALAETGSPRRAAAAVSRSAYGAEQLRKAEGAAGFSAAWDAALAFFTTRERGLLAEGVDAVAGKAAERTYFPPSRRAARVFPPRDFSGRGTARSAVEGPAQPESFTEQHQHDLDPDDREATVGWLETLLRKYLLKLRAERDARLAGKIAAADLYLRQLTHIEVMLDLMGGGLMEAFRDFRHRGHGLLDIAETPLSSLLDDVRRKHWQDSDEPPRPAPIPRDLLIEHDGFSTEPPEVIHGGPDEDAAAQQERFDRQHERDAKEQVRWEAEARRDYERRRERAAAHNQGEHRRPAGGRSRSGGGPAGRPAPEG